jgi:hypothetical protein
VIAQGMIAMRAKEGGHRPPFSLRVLMEKHDC